MSFVTAARDYVDFINQSYDSMSTHGNLLFLFHHTLLYLFESIKYSLFYLFSFRWMADLLYLPTLAPQLSMAILRENFFPLESPLVSSFSLLEAPSFLHNKFFIGFLNSFFVSLPTSALHLLAARRLLVEGIPAGVAAGIGTIIGQSCFLASILFGWRWVLIPWLSFEPLNYVVGLFVLLQTIYTICHGPSIKIIPPSERSTLLTFFFLNLFLTWCEQSSLFQYVGNLTLTSDPSYVEHAFASSRLSSFGTHALYLIGFVLGSCCFSFLFALMGLKLKDWWLRWSTMTTSRLINRLNFFFLVGVTALSLASIPYYGVDYLFTKGLGFIPEDKTLQGTVLSPAGMADPSQYLGGASNYESLDTDATPFDEGEYLTPSGPQTFEDLNYQGEQYWTGKMDRKTFSTSTGSEKGKSFGKRWANLFGANGSREVTLDVETTSTQMSRSIIGDGKNESPSSSSALLTSKDGSLVGEPLPWYREFDASSADPSFTPFFSDEEEVTASLSDLEKRDLEEEEWKRLSGPFSQETDEDSGEENEDLEKEEDEEVKEEDLLFNDFFTLIQPGFSPLFFLEIPESTNLEKYLKNKFYENPLYHLLLRVDIDTFLARQPSVHSLSSEQEVDLYRRRQLLADYYDSLQDFLELQEGERLNDFDVGERSYPDHVYNHQFKGTLKVVRRLFSMTLDPEENWKEERVLKFDQPLFHSVEAEQHPLVHEEETDFSTHLLPFIEMTNSRPFYAGWDEQLRKLVITTRYLPRYFSTHGMRIPDKHISQRNFKEYVPLTQRLNSLLPEGKNSKLPPMYVGEERTENLLFASTKKILFTAWPLPKKMAASASTDSQALASSVDGKVVERLKLFTNPQGEYHDWEIESWPENLRLDWSERDIILPTRGGFVWPGSSEFPFDVKKFIPDIKTFFQQ